MGYGFKLLHHIFTVITAICSIHVGLLAMGYNILGMPFIAPYALYIEYLFGISGLLNLLMFFMHSSFCDCIHSGERR